MSTTVPTTLPEFRQDVDDKFTNTWYEIRPDAIDNILDVNVVTALLKEKGSFKTQVGSKFIERTIRYGKKTATSVRKGDTLSQGEDELKTAAFWTWRYFATHVQRDLFDDQENSGKFKIKDYVKDRLQAAREAMEEKLEDMILGATQADETGRDVQGINDIVPQVAHYGGAGNWYDWAVRGTYGKIARPEAYSVAVQYTTGNSVYAPDPTKKNGWWGPNYCQLSDNWESTTLIEDMRRMYNRCTNHQKAPDIILTSQQVFEIYEDYALDKAQIIKEESTKIADLGFDVLWFKGKPLVWSPGVNPSDYPTKNQILFLNSEYIEVVYDPNLWFDMSEWKTTPQQTVRLAHIISAVNIITTQPRRHGRLYEKA